ncbi:MAG: hypothetical protein FWG52_10295 [Proteobacteria bacterium]|nr:hypothetical protein [Pseudomonadota bacterium]
MNWIYRQISEEELIFQLCCRVMTEEFIRNTIAYVKTYGTLWRVVETTARVDGALAGMKAGQSYRIIICDEIRRDEDTGELGYRSVPEFESPSSYSCPLHFLDMVPDVLNPLWRNRVRAFHEGEKRFQHSFKNAVVPAMVG